MVTLLSTLLAQTNVDITPGATGSFNSLTGVTIGSIVSFLVGAVLIVAGVIFFFMLVIGGIRWVLSGGDKASTEAARNQVTAALIGVVIVFSAFAIITFIQSVFGISIIGNLDFGNVTGGSVTGTTIKTPTK